MLFGAAASLVAAAIATTLSLRDAERETRREVQARAVATATTLAWALGRAGPEATQAGLDAFLAAPGTPGDVRVFAVDRSLRIIAANDRRNLGRNLEAALEQEEPDVAKVLSGASAIASGEMTHNGRSVLDATAPIRRDGLASGPIVGAVHVDVPRWTTASLLRDRAGTVLAAGVLLALLLLVPLVIYIETNLLRPLAAVAAANRAVLDGRREGRLVPMAAMPGNELGAVARMRNAMIQRLDDTEAEFARRLRELSELNGTSTRMGEVSLDGLLAQVLAKVVEITDADAGEISLLDGEGRLAVRAHQGFSEHWTHSGAARPVSCLCGSVVRSGAVVQLNDIATSPLATRPACLAEGYRAYCGLPMRIAGEAIGLISLHHREPPADTAHREDLLLTLGNLVAAIVVNARLYDTTRRLALVDPLTDVGNRRAFADRLAAEIERSVRHDSPCALLFLDIDHFKLVNDRLGHAAGDRALQWVAGVLKASVRGADFVGRWGGEEFVVLLVETSRDGARTVAERIRSEIASTRGPHCGPGQEFAVTVSIGVAALPGDPADSDALIAAADAAMYRAKCAGRNRVVAAGAAAGDSVVCPPVAVPAS
jgi:diguanylate cyclase (GGDEF)-like protein